MRAGSPQQGHLFLGREELCKAAFKMLNEKIPLPEMRVRQEEVGRELDAMILGGSVVSMRDSIYHPNAFAQEDETASRIARLLAEERPQAKDITAIIEAVRAEQGLRTSGKQEAAVRTAFLYNLSIITGSPGTGKTTVLKIILEVYRRMHPDRKTYGPGKPQDGGEYRI